MNKRKLIVLSMITLDGVLQGPGGPEEDTSGGFKYGGWVFPFFDDFSTNVIHEQMGRPFDLLLGKKTYDIWAAYWPHYNDHLIGKVINQATKYVATHTPYTPAWDKTVVLQGNVAEAVKKLKGADGPEIQVQGSGNLIQTLLKHDLIDEFWLKIFPITLGTGKRLFVEGTIPAAFKVSDSKLSPTGVIVASFERTGDVQTGSVV